jgi:hypothetical protein
MEGPIVADCFDPLVIATGVGIIAGAIGVGAGLGIGSSCGLGLVPSSFLLFHTCSFLPPS